MIRSFVAVGIALASLAAAACPAASAAGGRALMLTSDTINAANLETDLAAPRSPFVGWGPSFAWLDPGAGSRPSPAIASCRCCSTAPALRPMWIALSKPTYGIHGTPEPSLIDKTARMAACA